MATIAEASLDLHTYIVKPAGEDQNREVQNSRSRQEDKAQRRRMRSAVELTFSHIYSAVAPHFKPEKVEPVPTNAMICAAEYVTAIRALRAIQIFHSQYRTAAEREAGMPNFTGILSYSTRPDSPGNSNMEAEVLGLDLSRMK